MRDLKKTVNFICFISFKSFSPSFKGLARNFSHLLTLGHRDELGLQLLLDSADLPGPLGAVLLRHIAALARTETS